MNAPETAAFIPSPSARDSAEIRSIDAQTAGFRLEAQGGGRNQPVDYTSRADMSRLDIDQIRFRFDCIFQKADDGQDGQEYIYNDINRTAGFYGR